MKKIHQFKINKEHSVIVFATSSNSNYNRFISVVRTDKPKYYIAGTTVKEMPKNEYIEVGMAMLKHYQAENEMKYRIVTSDQKIKYAGTGENSWFTLVAAKLKVDYSKNEMIYEYDKEGNRLWEVL